MLISHVEYTALEQSCLYFVDVNWGSTIVDFVAVVVVDGIVAVVVVVAGGDDVAAVVTHGLHLETKSEDATCRMESTECLV